MKQLPAVGTGIAGLALVLALSRPPPRTARPTGGPLLPRPELLHVLGAAVQPLVVDYFWLGMIQQIGAAQRPSEYWDIYPYADLITDLDPRFHIVYVYGATALPFDMGREHWVNTRESTALIHKGLKVFPADYRLRFLLAYNLQYFDHDYLNAARTVEQLSKEPGAPSYLSALATRLYAQSGNFDAGLALAESLRDSARDPASRDFYQHRVEQLVQERVLRQVDAAAQRYLQREGHRPKDLQELVRAGDLRALPIDPLGGQIYLGPDGEALSTAIKHRLELYTVGDAPGQED